MSGAYKIGYKNPPISGQFKPGQSGNPLGRKKKAKSGSFHSALYKQLNQKIKVMENGRERVISHDEFLVKKLFEMAAKGDMRAMREIMAAKNSEEYRGLENNGQADNELGAEIGVWMKQYQHSLHTAKQFVGLEKYLGFGPLRILYSAMSNVDDRKAVVTEDDEYYTIKLKKIPADEKSAGPWPWLLYMDIPEAVHFKNMLEKYES